MTKKKKQKLSKEILGLLAVTSIIALFLMQLLSTIARAVVDSYIFAKDLIVTEVQYLQLDAWVLRLSLLISISFFVILFLFLLGERLSYIHEIFVGIHALQNGQDDYVIALEGNNELTQLAEAVNFLSKTQREIKEKERELSDEKEQFIRALSHDIRTPLTSIISYSELLSEENEVSQKDQIRYIKLIGEKAGRIKEMTDILLDGNRQNLEYFENANFLMEQLIAEFEEILEDDFYIEASMECPAFSGTFDVQQLHRIFDNLISNVQKYADKDKPVKLMLSLRNQQLIICQKNRIRKQNIPTEGYQIGLRSIQRIVQNYEGWVDVKQEDKIFAITIALSVR